ncbi:hypothetical protein BU23DRAFT_656678 [Bimuria novae-zelandiae CBS 107.79]|uniref:Uncharacterized protein n=1 Tax=Bimuria novae-zelandiae CBS 107.79 TaxID=1447943 RepID=A0A6A5UW54_9PLEO|nr:hypothetical protein BU23DRAFT_656678 [Bimuria novae-zelandiae CBS 107.79]
METESLIIQDSSSELPYPSGDNAHPTLYTPLTLFRPTPSSLLRRRSFTNNWVHVINSFWGLEDWIAARNPSYYMYNTQKNSTPTTESLNYIEQVKERLDSAILYGPDVSLSFHGRKRAHYTYFQAKDVAVYIHTIEHTIEKLGLTEICFIAAFDLKTPGMMSAVLTICGSKKGEMRDRFPNLEKWTREQFPRTAIRDQGNKSAHGCGISRPYQGDFFAADEWRRPLDPQEFRQNVIASSAHSIENISGETESYEPEEALEEWDEGASDEPSDQPDFGTFQSEENIFNTFGSQSEPGSDSDDQANDALCPDEPTSVPDPDSDTLEVFSMIEELRDEPPHNRQFSRVLFRLLVKNSKIEATPQH